MGRMIEPDAHRLQRALPPTVAFAGLTAILSLMVFAAAYALTSKITWPVGLAVGLFIAGMVMAANRMRISYPHAVLGSCNAVTQLRAAMTAVLVVPVLIPEAMITHRIEILGLAALALALDGVDGWLARRSALCSDFGARFDMEVDSALAAILACLLLPTVSSAVEVVALLVLGFARYGFVVAICAFRWLAAPLPTRWSRKAVCVAQIGALISTLALPVLALTLPFVAAAVLWSFAKDIRWLARRRI